MLWLWLTMSCGGWCVLTLAVIFICKISSQFRLYWRLFRRWVTVVFPILWSELWMPSFVEYIFQVQGMGALEPRRNSHFLTCFLWEFTRTCHGELLLLWHMWQATGHTGWWPIFITVCDLRNPGPAPGEGEAIGSWPSHKTQQNPYCTISCKPTYNKNSPWKKVIKQLILFIFSRTLWEQWLLLLPSEEMLW